MPSFFNTSRGCVVGVDERMLFRSRHADHTQVDEKKKDSRQDFKRRDGLASRLTDLYFNYICNDDEMLWESCECSADHHHYPKRPNVYLHLVTVSALVPMAGV
jgi:hypothetical protein